MYRIGWDDDVSEYVVVSKDEVMMSFNIEPFLDWTHTETISIDGYEEDDEGEEIECETEILIVPEAFYSTIYMHLAPKCKPLLARYMPHLSLPKNLVGPIKGELCLLKS